MAGRAATGQRPDRDTEGCEDMSEEAMPNPPRLSSPLSVSKVIGGNLGDSDRSG